MHRTATMLDPRFKGLNPFVPFCNHKTVQNEALRYIRVTTRCDGELPVTVDVTVTHPFAPSLCLNLRLARAAIGARERQKFAKNQLLDSVDFTFIPFPVSTFGDISG